MTRSQLLLGDQRAHLGAGVHARAELDALGDLGHAVRRTSSKRSSWTNRREPATQHWPWLKKIALAAPSTAARMSASSKTMFGLLPPSSSVTFFRLPVGGLHDQLADLGRAGEGDLVDVVVGGQGGARGLAEAGDDVDHAVRERRPRR